MKAKLKCPWCPTLVKDTDVFTEHLKRTHPGRYAAEPFAQPIEWYTTPPERVRPQKDLPGQAKLFEFGGGEHMED